MAGTLALCVCVGVVALFVLVTASCCSDWRYVGLGVGWCGVAKGSMDVLANVTSLWRADVRLCVAVGNCSWSRCSGCSADAVEGGVYCAVLVMVWHRRRSVSGYV